MLPYFSGERTPINDFRARGVIIGLKLAHSKYHIFRAILESVAFGIRHNLDTFHNFGAEVKRVIAVGGGTKSPVWLQIVSDVSGVEQIVPALTIGASYGDSFLAGLISGTVKKEDLYHWVKPGYIGKPDFRQRPKYDDLYSAYQSLYMQTKDIVHKLGD